MNGLPPDIVRQINKYQPVKIEGMTLYPVTVDEYADFSFCAPALGYMQQSLPVALLSKPILTAFYELELDEAQAFIRDGDNGLPKAALFTRCLISLILALRLGVGEPIEQRLDRARVSESKKGLKAIVFRGNDGEAITVTPTQFTKLRPVIAAQNGIEIPPITANPELVEADRDVRMANAPQLDMKIEDKITFAALTCGADEAEVYEWPILKFERRTAIAERTLDFLIYGIGEKSGMVKYKEGNPYPSPYFARKYKSRGMIALSDFRKGAEQDIKKAKE